MTIASNRRLKQALLDRDLNLVQLAKLTGYVHGSIRNVACGWDKSKPARRRIEQALGVAIWSTPGEMTTGQESKPATPIDSL
jgi:hypothetical protein